MAPPQGRKLTAQWYRLAGFHIPTWLYHWVRSPSDGIVISWLAFTSPYGYTTGSEALLIASSSVGWLSHSHMVIPLGQKPFWWHPLHLDSIVISWLAFTFPHGHATGSEALLMARSLQTAVLYGFLLTFPFIELVDFPIFTFTFGAFGIMCKHIYPNFGREISYFLSPKLKVICPKTCWCPGPVKRPNTSCK